MSGGRPKLISLDAFAKTVEDARIKTASGGIITLICVFIVLILIRNEYSEYTSVIVRPDLVVDRDINKKLDINIDMTFPNIPCGLLTLDILESSGDVQIDILKSGFDKYRVTSNGQIVDDIPILSQSRPISDVAKGLGEGETGECGACYGALPQDNNQYCCNSCEAVRLAYAEKSWGFHDGEGIEQCVREGYVAKIKERIENNEGCRIKGTAQINRISGNFHFAPGVSATSRGRHSHDLSLYTKHPDKFNFDHNINHLSFGSQPASSFAETASTRPLDGLSFGTGSKNHIYSYYLKVVATRFEYLNGRGSLDTNQISVIRHDRPLRGGRDDDHEHTMHQIGGLPGVFFHFDISPMKIINREAHAKTWSGFVLGVVSSIAGVLMVGALIDRSVWVAEKAIKGKKDM